MDMSKPYASSRWRKYSAACRYQKAMSNYGFEIVQTLIIDVVPAETVKKTMNEINAAARNYGWP